MQADTGQLPGQVDSLLVLVDSQVRLLQGIQSDLTVGNHLDQGLVGNLHLMQGGSPQRRGQAGNLQHQGLVDNLQHLGQGDNLQHPGLVDNLQDPGPADNLQHPGRADSLQHPGLVDNLQHPGRADSLQGLVDSLQKQEDNPAGLVGSQVHQDIPDIHRVASEGTTNTFTIKSHQMNMDTYFDMINWQ